MQFWVLNTQITSQKKQYRIYLVEFMKIEIKCSSQESGDIFQ